jgi:hypothetical protein
MNMGKMGGFLQHTASGLVSGLVSGLAKISLKL